MMKIKTLMVAMMAVMTVGVGSNDYASAVQKEKNVAVKNVSSGYATEDFVVVSKTCDGMLNAESLNEKTNAPHGYILDNKYEIGDIVRVTYKDDDILSEKKISSKDEAKPLEAMKNQVTEKFVVVSVTKDGMLNAKSLSEKTNAPYGYILDNKYQIGDIVEVTYWNDDILSEKKISGSTAKKPFKKEVSSISGVKPVEKEVSSITSIKKPVSKVEVEEKKSSKAVVDKIENGTAHLIDDNGTESYVSADKLSENTVESDVVELTIDDEDIKIEVSKEETAERKARAEELIQKLLNKNNNQPVVQPSVDTQSVEVEKTSEVSVEQPVVENKVLVEQELILE